uniref:HAD family hydrolase n=1 Tax=uncultured bacterium 20 TaxID=1748270 RepID=A0A0U3BBU5_9BACT|nr:HAD family hydrolase [uncultured bacterium 20]
MITPGATGQFEILADGERIAERGGNWFTRRLGAGYPDLESVVAQLRKRRDKGQ